MSCAKLSFEKVGRSASETNRTRACQICRHSRRDRTRFYLDESLCFATPCIVTRTVRRFMLGLFCRRGTSKEEPAHPTLCIQCVPVPVPVPVHSNNNNNNHVPSPTSAITATIKLKNRTNCSKLRRKKHLSHPMVAELEPGCITTGTC